MVRDSENDLVILLEQRHPLSNECAGRIRSLAAVLSCCTVVYPTFHQSDLLFASELLRPIVLDDPGRVSSFESKSQNSLRLFTKLVAALNYSRPKRILRMRLDFTWDNAAVRKLVDHYCDETKPIFLVQNLRDKNSLTDWFYYGEYQKFNDSCVAMNAAIIAGGLATTNSNVEKLWWKIFFQMDRVSEPTNQFLSDRNLKESATIVVRSSIDYGSKDLKIRRLWSDTYFKFSGLPLYVDYILWCMTRSVKVFLWKNK